MKPSERCAELRASFGPGYTDTYAIGQYLDEEAERRAKFEADVLARLAKLESSWVGVSAVDPRTGERRRLDPLYVGDGHPRVRLLSPDETPELNAACTGPVYEPEANEPEPEGKA